MRSLGRYTTSACASTQRSRIGSSRGCKSITTRDRPYHVLVVGDSSVGKSALTVRYIARRFLTEYAPQSELTVKRCVDIDSSRLHIAITDSAGTIDVLPNISHIDGIMVVYDISRRTSFATAINILDSILQDNVASRLPKSLIGNKADLEHLRQVSTIEGEIVAAQYDTLDCVFNETSAENGVESVDKAFQTLLRQIVQYKDNKAFTSSAYASHSTLNRSKSLRAMMNRFRSRGKRTATI